jgi:hypothetical protein
MRSPSKLFDYIKFCELRLKKGINGETYVSPAEVLIMVEKINAKFEQPLIEVEKTAENVTIKYENEAVTINNEDKNRTWHFKNVLWNIVKKPINFVKKHLKTN